MSEIEVRETVRKLVAETLGLAVERATPEAKLMIELGAESIDLLDLRFRLERSFGFGISNEDLARTFGDGVTEEAFRAALTVEALGSYVVMRLEAAVHA
ncbi:MAG TPA: phosphopantetheine-binding protein [Myxococcaceae bacterium]|nr:phosphopantetheine-binding protein [Myxococcaceae bacterium]